jgi:hypothetical protein
MIDRYDLERPTADSLVRSLQAVLGHPSAEAAIGLAVRDTHPPLEELDSASSEQLLGIARALIRQRGLCAIIGRSFEIRLISYLELAARGQEVGHGHG